MQDTDIVITILEEELPTKSPPLQKGKIRILGTPDVATVRILCSQKVIQAIEEHAQSSMDREVGGILVGDVYQYKGNTYVEIQEYVQARCQQSGQQSSRTHFGFTPEIWAQMNRDKDQYFDDLKTVGWFHSHPGHGIFLSPGMDTKIQEEFFTRPWQTAMVYDPHRHEGGFFIWQGSQVQPAPGFYEVYDEQNKDSIIKWKNLSGAAHKKPRSSSVKSNWTSVITLTLAFIIFFISFISMFIILDMRMSLNQQRIQLEETINDKFNDLSMSFNENARGIEILQTSLDQIAKTQIEHTAAIAELQGVFYTLQESSVLTNRIMLTTTPTISNGVPSNTSLLTETQIVTMSQSLTITEDVTQTATHIELLETSIALTQGVRIQDFEVAVNQEDIFEIPISTTFQICTPLVISVTEEVTVSLWMSFSHAAREIDLPGPEITHTFDPSETTWSYCFSLPDVLTTTAGLWIGNVYMHRDSVLDREILLVKRIDLKKQDGAVKVNIMD